MSPASAELGAATKVCATRDWFVIPEPPMVNMNLGVAEIVNASASGLKTMPLISTVSARNTSRMSETAKVAVSAGPLGMVLGVQLAAVFQSPLVGLRFQVALPANE